MLHLQKWSEPPLPNNNKTCAFQDQFFFYQTDYATSQFFSDILQWTLMIKTDEIQEQVEPESSKAKLKRENYFPPFQI